MASDKIIPKDGKINYIYNGDWYSNEFIIKILFNNVPNGYINVINKFNDLEDLNFYK